VGEGGAKRRMRGCIHKHKKQWDSRRETPHPDRIFDAT
jgi:hypothetical protein